MIRRVPEPQIDGRALRYAHRRPELLAAAIEYVLAHGVGGLSLRPMAAALGVSHATLLRHFDTKERLLAEVVEQLRRQVFDQIEHDEQLRSADSAAQLARSMWSRLADDPSQRRQFIVLAEIYAIGLRNPDRFADLLTASVNDFLGPIEQRLAADGIAHARTPALATALLALIRGLQLDLAATDDRQRTTAAFDAAVQALLG